MGRKSRTVGLANPQHSPHKKRSIPKHEIICPHCSKAFKIDEAGYADTPMRPAEVMPWGQTIAYVADINGFLVELCTPMA